MRRFFRFTQAALLLLMLAAWPCMVVAQSDAALQEKLRAASAVITQAQTDMIAAAKRADVVFEAARALHQKGLAEEAHHYFEHGLRLSPWSLEEQLAHASLLREMKREEEAAAKARMVRQRAESDALFRKALTTLGEPASAPPAPWDGDASQPWICFVKIGDVEDVMLRDVMAKLSATLGITTALLDDKLGLPKPHRSSFDRWMSKQLLPAIDWFTPPARALLKRLGKSVPEEVDPGTLLAALAVELRREGAHEKANDLENTANHLRKNDAQWSAQLLVDQLQTLAQKRGTFGPGIVVGITQADLFQGDSNFVYGTALTGKRVCVVSSARFRAEFNDEPPDRSRLVTRLHKQLLSSIGFALGVPRPTDPTSARSYPASLQEHDAKSEFMSAACIKGFERALDRKLPLEAWPPEARATRPAD